MIVQAHKQPARQGNVAIAGSVDTSGAQPWRIAVDRTSLRMEQPFALDEGEQPLAAHADWPGPTKVCRGRAGLMQRVEFCVGTLLHASDPLDEMAEATPRNDESSLRNRLLAVGEHLGQGSVPEGWTPPAAAQLAGWLTDLSHESAIDQDGNLRLTLKGHQADGQVRIERGPGRLRLTMPLGRWPTLDAAPRTAMRRLAEVFNDRTRMVRIAWIVEPTVERIEAQVDLSGMPIVSRGTNGDIRQHERLWSELLRAATGGLRLALQQLAAELTTLADESHRDLVEVLL